MTTGVASVNLNNEEYPDYADPDLNVTVTSSSPAETQATFSAVMKVLASNLRTVQLSEGASQASLIRLRTISGSGGPVAQAGSREAGTAHIARPDDNHYVPGGVVP